MQAAVMFGVQVTELGAALEGFRRTLGGVRLEVKTPRVRHADRTPTDLHFRQRAHAAQQLLLEIARCDVR